MGALLNILFGQSMPKRPWDEVPRDQFGNPIPLPGMPRNPGMPGPQAPAQPAAPPQAGGWRNKIGNIIQSSLEGAATPNIAGGGGADVIRSLAAGGRAAQERSLLDYNMGRQREQDDLNRRKAEAQIGADEAHAEYWKDQGAAARMRQEPKERDLAEEAKALMEQFPELTYMEALQFVTRQTLPRAPVPKPEVPMVEISPELGKSRGLMPNAEGKYLVPANSAAAREALRQVPPQRPVILNPNQTVLDKDNKAVYTAPPAPPKGPPARGGGSATKQAPRSVFAGIGNRYRQRQADANRLAETGQITWEAAERLKKQAEEDYHSSILDAGGSTDYFDKKKKAGGPPAAMGAAKKPLATKTYQGHIYAQFEPGGQWVLQPSAK